MRCLGNCFILVNYNIFETLCLQNEQQCETNYETECSTTYETVSEEQCRVVQETKVWTVINSLYCQSLSIDCLYRPVLDGSGQPNISENMS